MGHRVVPRAVGLLLTLSATGSAHDLWIVPGRFAVEPGTTFPVFVNNADRFPLAATLLAPRRVAAFVARDATGIREVGALRVDGASLVADVEARGPGSLVLALATRPRRVRLRADELAAYLEEEGLPPVERPPEAGAVTERYTKWAKAIVRVGEPSDRGWAEPVGHRFELVPLESPFALRPGRPWPLRVLLDGRPVADASVVGGRAGGPHHVLFGRTDERGEIVVRLEGEGRWYLRALHVVPDEEDPQVDWESFWASLTFEVVAEEAP